ncbi:hypothetical protein F2Q70_00037860 [Brassica cretica]|uniref:RING-type E3 ubiquitin transferase n=1 Tax=Brassica cretica TaxID=69181 RepID=A0A8S9JTW1_BRACR|nr:hypothetical protein F2Q70_00037860 [Brassica cretica]
MFDNEAGIRGNPPAAKSVIEDLPVVELTLEEGEVVCAVCKDEMIIEEEVKRLPCRHLYHGECITPWLGIRNTCPVCRFELPTDDLDYERQRRSQRSESSLFLAGSPLVSYRFNDDCADFERTGEVVCAVCKDEMIIEEEVKRLPCRHLYHGECITPWLGIRNTCPVCRFELPTDDLEYERHRGSQRSDTSLFLAGSPLVSYRFNDVCERSCSRLVLISEEHVGCNMNVNRMLKPL